MLYYSCDAKKNIFASQRYFYPWFTHIYLTIGSKKYIDIKVLHKNLSILFLDAKERILHVIYFFALTIIAFQCDGKPYCTTV